MLAYRLLAEELPLRKAQARLPGVDWAAVQAADATLALETDPVKRIGIYASLPDFLAARLVVQYGADEASALAYALNQRAPQTLRVNTLKATLPEMLGTLSKAGLRVHPAQFSACGIELETHANIFGLPQFAEGKIEVQDEGSQLIAQLAAPHPHGLVIGYFAGAGGKTLALGALMHNRGRLLALDVNEKRLAESGGGARRAGLTNARDGVSNPSGDWPDELRQYKGKGRPRAGRCAVQRGGGLSAQTGSALANARSRSGMFAPRTGSAGAAGDATVRARRPLDL